MRICRDPLINEMFFFRMPAENAGFNPLENSEDAVIASKAAILKWLEKNAPEIHLKVNLDKLSDQNNQVQKILPHLNQLLQESETEQEITSIKFCIYMLSYIENYDSAYCPEGLMNIIYEVTQNIEGYKNLDKKMEKIRSNIISQQILEVLRDKRKSLSSLDKIILRDRENDPKKILLTANETHTENAVQRAMQKEFYALETGPDIRAETFIKKYPESIEEIVSLSREKVKVALTVENIIVTIIIYDRIIDRLEDLLSLMKEKKIALKLFITTLS